MVMEELVSCFCSLLFREWIVVIPIHWPNNNSTASYNFSNIILISNFCQSSKNSTVEFLNAV
jgi:hypothetical protein